MQWHDFIVMPAVGAVVGALTNRIAISMLFRPYDSVHVGRLRIPFTPGVIPANRAALAAKIAQTFEANLLSGEDLHSVITGPHIQSIIKRRVDGFFAKLGPLGRMFRRFKPQVTQRFLEALEETGREALADGGEFDIAQKIEQRINDLEMAQLEALVLDVADRQLRHVTWFGGMLGAMIGLLQAALTGLL
jgi:uncharacterized membrane protein YheB (UPF0754 family)